MTNHTHGGNADHGEINNTHSSNVTNNNITTINIYIGDDASPDTLIKTIARILGLKNDHRKIATLKIAESIPENELQRSNIRGVER